MARELTPEEDARVVLKSLPGQSKYPWDEWLNGNKWVLDPDKDFTCQLQSFRTAIYREASNRGLQVQSKLIDGRLVVKAVKADW